MSNALKNLMSRGGLSFAHLGRSQARAAEEDPPADDDSGKGKKGKRAEDDKDSDEQNREDGDSKKSKRADNDSSGDDKESDEDDEVDEDGEGSGKGKRGKKAKRADDDNGGEDPEAEDDDDDEEEMHGKSSAARARRRERARCAAIFACKAAGRNTELAAALAFESTMTRKQAIAVLNKAPASGGNVPVRRNPNLGAGGDSSVSPEQAVAASWDVAFKKAGAQRRAG